MKEYQLHWFTDDKILSFSNKRKLINSLDINLKSNESFPYKGGLFDHHIFGSNKPGSCECGRTKKFNEICPDCGSKRLEEKEKYLRCAYFKLYCYVSIYNKEIADLLTSNFTIDKQLPEEWVEFDLKDLIDFAGFTLKDGKLIISNKPKSLNSYGLEGVLSVCTTKDKSLGLTVRDLMNEYLLILNPIVRPYKVMFISGKKELILDTKNIYYRAIIEASNHLSETVSEWKLNPEVSAAEISMVNGIFRKYYRQAFLRLNNLKVTSKESDARNSVGTRLTNTARGTIIPDITLNPDEVRLPDLATMELYLKRFVKWFCDRYSKGYQSVMAEVRKAPSSFLEEFYEFVNSEVPKVLILRNPSLSEYSLLSFKVKLWSRPGIGICPSITKGFNADFDGDQMAVYTFDEEMENYMFDNTNPLAKGFFKVSLKPVITPSKESFGGLIILSKIVSVKSPKSFKTFEEVELAHNEGSIDIWDTIKFNNKVTTYGRLLFNQTLGVDLDSIIGDAQINAKNLVTIIKRLYVEKDAASKLKDLQNLGFKIATYYNNTITFDDLKFEVDKSKIEEIQYSDLSPSEKLIKLYELNESITSNILNNLSEQVKLSMETSGRLSPQQLLEMIKPQMVVDSESYMTSSSLAKGMTRYDYIKIAAESRKLQEVKYQSVQIGGYGSRQFSMYPDRYIIKVTESDKKNGGILIPSQNSIGRTTLDGIIIEKVPSTPYIKVRSFANTKKTYVTGDMISTPLKDRFKDGDNYSLSVLLQSSADFTQAGLSFKHKSNYRIFDDNDVIKAPDNGSISVRETWIYFEAGNKVYRIPKPNNFIAYPKTTFKKGEIIGFNNLVKNVNYNVDNLFTALGVKIAGGVTNPIFYTDAISISNGTIKYKTNESAIIGNKEYYINPNVTCYYWEGESVSEYKPISTGIVSFGNWMYSLDIDTLYLLYRSQITLLAGNLIDEVIELLFQMAYSNSFELLESAIRSNKSIVSHLIYGYSGEIFDKQRDTKRLDPNDFYTEFLFNNLFK